MQTLPLILDGATGVRLMEAGMPGGACPELWITEHPDVLREIQKGYITAGSDAVYAPTFGANRMKLGEYGLADKVRELNIRLIEISRSAAGDKLVGGNLSSAGQFLKPAGDIGFHELTENYAEQVDALEEAGVDFYAAETLMGMAEARACILAVRERSDKPVLVTVSCNEQGRTLTGGDIRAILVTAQSMGAFAFGLNCSSGPGEMLENIAKLFPLAKIPLVAKPNAGLPAERDGIAVYDMNPAVFAAYAERFAELGVRIFGGCCGTNDTHIAALAREVARLNFPESVGSADGTRHVCTSEKGIYLIDDTAVSACVLTASPSLEDEILSLDEGVSSLKVRINDAAGLSCFEECAYLIDLPVCFDCPDERLFEQALRIYNGRAYYDGKSDFGQDFLNKMTQKYGLVF